MRVASTKRLFVFQLLVCVGAVVAITGASFANRPATPTTSPAASPAAEPMIEDPTYDVPASEFAPVDDSVDALIGPATGPELHVMTYNLRIPVDASPNSWPERRDRVAAILTAEQPTILGVQETQYDQVRDVADRLPAHYAWVGEGRQGGSHGDIMAVFYDAGRLDPLEYDHVWLSETPRLVGSISWNSNNTRMLTWVRFVDRWTGTEFVVMNTHLDHISAPARRHSATLIREVIAALGPAVPVVLLGDFNATADTSKPWQILTTEGGLVDTWLTAKEQRTPVYKTFTGYRPLTKGGRRIDWILTTPDVTTSAAAINTAGARDGRYPSDHLAVQSVIELPTVTQSGGS